MRWRLLARIWLLTVVLGGCAHTPRGVEYEHCLVVCWQYYADCRQAEELCTWQLGECEDRCYE